MSSTPASLAIVIYTNDDTAATAVPVLGESKGEGEVKAKGESEGEVEDEDEDEDDDAIGKSILLSRF
jgi:hypothetical protein